MANFWLTKKVLLEALKMSEGRPDNACISFEGSSEIKNNVEYTVVNITAFGKKKTVKQPFNKLSL